MTDTQKIYLSLRKVNMQYPNSSWRLSDISIDVPAGEIVAICGKSGIGKSTLVRIISGLTKPSSGAIKINGEELTKVPSSVGLVTQDYSRSLLPWMRIESNVSLPFRGTRISKEERKARALEVLREVGLKNELRKYPWQLSGGMQQRVAIARALVTRPKLLLLDEPFASLDAITRLELEDLVLKLASEYKMTMVIVTHDLDEAIYLSDKVYCLSGVPTKLNKSFEVKLERPRNQILSKSNSHFNSLRKMIYEAIV